MKGETGGGLTCIHDQRVVFMRLNFWTQTVNCKLFENHLRFDSYFVVFSLSVVRNPPCSVPLVLH